MIDSTQIIIAIVTAIPPTLAAIIAISKINTVHVAINSRMDKWMAVERSQGHSDGMAQEKKDEAQKRETIRRRRSRLLT